MKKFEWYNTCGNFPPDGREDEGKCRWKKFGWFRKCADCLEDDCEDERKVCLEKWKMFGKSETYFTY